ncbi:MAG: hypothetical protein H6716_09185 [Polyangiaceae bacterium]|nr:hypothetical protein [Polyangiaceae bacterium]
MLTAFVANKRWVYENLSAAQYRELHLDVYVSGLLRVQRHIFSRPEAPDRLRAMMVGLVMEPWGDESVPYPPAATEFNVVFWRDMWSPESAAYVESALCKRDPTCAMRAKRLAYWMHGFWLRRNNEGNVAAVAKILGEIEKHYSG